MKKSQLNSISRNNQQKRRIQESNYLSQNNLWDRYIESKYKTMGGYIRSLGVNPYK